MATTSNIIEVLIRSQIEGGQNLLAFRRELESLQKTGTAAQRVFAQGVLQGMDAELRGIIPQLLQTTQQSEGTTRALEKQSRQTRLLTNDKLGLRRALSLVLVNIGDLGPAGNIASGALLSIATGAGVAGAAIGLTSTAIALIVRHFQEAKEKKEAFDQALRTGNLAFFQAEIAATDEALLDLGNRLDDVRRKLAESRAAGVRGDGFLESLQSGLTGQEGDIAKRRAELVAEQQNILARRAQTAGLQLEFQTEALRANSIEQQELAHQLRITNALQGDLKDAAQDTKDAFINQSAVLRDAEIGQILKRQGEESKRKSEAEVKAIEAARASIVGQIEAVRQQTVALEEGERAAILYGIANLANSDIIKKLGADGKLYVDILREERLALLDKTEAVKRLNEEQARFGFVRREEETEEGVRLGRQFNADDIKAFQSVAQQELSALQQSQQRINLIDNARAENLREQLSVLQLIRAPYSQILEVVERIDNLEKERLNTQIRQKDAIRDLLQAQVESGVATEEQVRQLAQINNELDILRTKVGTVGTGTLQLGINVKGEAENVAQDLSRTFVDRFIALVKDEEVTLGNFLAGVGETIASQFIEAMLTKILEKSILDMVTQGLDVEQYKKFGVGGVLFGALLGGGSARPPGGQQPQSPIGGSFNVEEEIWGGMALQIDQTSDSLATLSQISDKTSLAFGETIFSIDHFIRSLSSLGGGGGGGIFGSIFGLISGIGGLFGGGSFVPGSATGVEAAHFAKGGMVLAGAGVGSSISPMMVNRYNLPRLAQGAIARGPTLAVIGEGGEDEFILPRSKMEKMMSKNNGAQSQPTVIINGDITPRRPDMRAEDVVQIVSDNMNRNGPIGKATVNVIKRNR